jgi:mannitol-1-phosphate 5-dehydrogenase
MSNEILIIGAGKIGRGYIGQIFYRSGFRLWFVDADEELVHRLNAEKKYRVDLAGEYSDETEYILLEKAFMPGDHKNILEVMNRVEIMAVSVGANNLVSIGILLRRLLEKRDKKTRLNCLICENFPKPAGLIRSVLLKDAGDEMADFVNHKLGLVETQVLRTGMPAKPEILVREPLALRMQDWWTLPLDKKSFVGNIPDVHGFRPKENFEHESIRKLYTFNGTNGPIAYVGWVNGYRILHEAAHAMLPFIQEIQEESAWGLLHEYGFKAKEHREYMSLAFKKYTDPALSDQIERNARDLRRKLGKEERLLGPALLCLKHGRKPFAYARAIAAAYCYDGSDDEGTMAVRSTIQKKGIGEAIKEFSGLDDSDELYSMIVEVFNNKTYLNDPDHLQ